MAGRVRDALVGAGCDSVVLVGGDPAWADRLGLPVVADQWPGEGPLAGVATALAHHRGGLTAGDVLVVAACDQPWLTATAVDTLVAALEATPTTRAAFPRAPDAPDGFDPLPGAWRAAAGPAVQAALDAGERRLGRVARAVFPLLVDLPRGTTRDVDVSEDLLRYPGSVPAGEPPTSQEPDRRPNLGEGRGRT